MLRDMRLLFMKGYNGDKRTRRKNYYYDLASTNLAFSLFPFMMLNMNIILVSWLQFILGMQVRQLCILLFSYILRSPLWSRDDRQLLIFELCIYIYTCMSGLYFLARGNPRLFHFSSIGSNIIKYLYLLMSSKIIWRFHSTRYCSYPLLFFTLVQGIIHLV